MNRIYVTVTQKIRVLNCAPDKQLCALRAEVLTLNGCEVVCTNNVQDAIVKMKEADFKVLLLCYELSDQEVDTLCEQFGRIRPAGRIVDLHYREGTTGRCKDSVLVSAYQTGAVISAVTKTVRARKAGRVA